MTLSAIYVRSHIVVNSLKLISLIANEHGNRNRLLNHIKNESHYPKILTSLLKALHLETMIMLTFDVINVTSTSHQMQSIIINQSVSKMNQTAEFRLSNLELYPLSNLIIENSQTMTSYLKAFNQRHQRELIYRLQYKLILKLLNLGLERM